MFSLSLFASTCRLISFPTKVLHNTSALFPFEIYLPFVFTYFAREKFPRKFLNYLQFEWHRSPFAFFRPPPLALPQDTIKFRFFSLLFSFPPSPSEFSPLFLRMWEMGRRRRRGKKWVQKTPEIGASSSSSSSSFSVLVVACGAAEDS